MRFPLVALLVAAASLSTGLALAEGHAPTTPAPAAHAPTPPNPDKIIRPQTPAVKTTPTVSFHTAVLAEKHDQIAQNPSKPIPAKLRIAKQEVLERNQEVSQSRAAFRSESASIESQAHALAHPTKGVYSAYTGRVDQVEVPATPEALAQASETYVSSAQLLVSKSGNLSQRVARENPDQGAKTDAAKAMVADYKKGAGLYRLSAEAEDRRADGLTAQGKLPEAQVARDKAHNTRFVADKFDRKAVEIETSGVPGADAYELPAQIQLSSK